MSLMLKAFLLTFLVWRVIVLVYKQNNSYEEHLTSTDFKQLGEVPVAKVGVGFIPFFQVIAPNPSKAWDFEESKRYMSFWYV